jgi:hypothetical protein
VALFKNCDLFSQLEFLVLHEEFPLRSTFRVFASTSSRCSVREKCCSTMTFERDTMFGPIMDVSRLSHYPCRSQKIIEQRCSVSQERCSVEQQSNAGENSDIVGRRLGGRCVASPSITHFTIYFCLCACAYL